MNLKEYFEETSGLGIIATADSDGKSIPPYILNQS